MDNLLEDRTIPGRSSYRPTVSFLCIMPLYRNRLDAPLLEIPKPELVEPITTDGSDTEEDCGTPGTSCGKVALVPDGLEAARRRHVSVSMWLDESEVASETEKERALSIRDGH